MILISTNIQKKKKLVTYKIKYIKYCNFATLAVNVISGVFKYISLLIGAIMGC